MAQTTNISVPARTWTQISDGNIAAVTFQNVSEFDIFIRGTVGAVAPTGGASGIKYEPTRGEVNRPMTDLFPGTSGANRLYAYSESNAVVFISNA